MLDATKEYDPRLARPSVQAQSKPSPIDDLPFGLGRSEDVLWLNLARFSEEIPPWSIYPGARDFYLRNIAKYEPMMASALYSMKTRMITLGFEVQGPKRAKKYAADVLRTADFGRGIESLLARGTDDLLSTDNGLFIERIGAGRPDKPLRGPVLAVAHLDSRRCYRTFNPEYPVIYDNPETSAMHRLHHSRVVMTADNPQPIERARGIGLCAVSRALQWVRIIRDTLTYREEKVAGKFTRGIGITKGITVTQLKNALTAADNNSEGQGFVVYKGIPFIGTPGYEGADLDLVIHDLASIPDGFEFESDLTLYAYVLAFAFGVDAREFWPATAAGATKADATVQNQKARGRGIGALIRTWEWVLRQCLPETVEFTFDFTDDEQDLMRHQVQGARLGNLSRLQIGGAISAQEYRALAIADGIIDPKVLDEVGSPPIEESAPSEGEVETPQGEPSDEDTPEGEGGEKTIDAAPFEKSLSSYQASLNSAARGIWNGSLTLLGGQTALESAITRGLTQGWYEGAAQCGIQPEDLTEDELNALQRLIADNVQYVPGLVEYIDAHSKASGGTLDSLSGRLALWINRYGEARNLGKLKACSDQKLKWVLGATEQHCNDCGGVAGRVYRASTWDKYGWEPRSSKLQCSGRRCDCELELTDERVTPGRPPSIIGQKDHAHTH